MQATPCVRSASNSTGNWRPHKADAGAALAEALRISQDKKADKQAAALTLKKYPPQEAWIVDYTTNDGRHIKTFAKKKEADEFAATARVEVRHGIHTPSSKSITVAEAGKLWLASAEKNNLERTTIDGYKQHLALHIEPFLGSTRLSDLSIPMVREFEDKLSADKSTSRSPALIKKVRGSLGAISCRCPRARLGGSQCGARASLGSATR